MVGGIVLAAGTSSRLGRPKQRLMLGRKPVLQHVIDACDGSGLDEIIVVLGHDASAVADALAIPRHARLVINDDYEMGQSTSLRTGFDSLSSDTTVAVVVLGDQPGLEGQMIDRVIDASVHAPIVRSVFGETPGHPVAIARSEWRDVASVDGDTGARDHLAAHPERVLELRQGDKPLADIDTEADFEALRTSWPANPNR